MNNTIFHPRVSHWSIIYNSFILVYVCVIYVCIRLIRKKDLFFKLFKNTRWKMSVAQEYSGKLFGKVEDCSDDLVELATVT